MKKIKLFTHTDLDGVGCAIIAKKAFESEDVKLDITYNDYDEINKNVKKWLDYAEEYDRCFITDISISKELADKINNMNLNVVLLDHHPTALYLNDYEWCVVEIENENGIKTCGTELLFNYLNREYFSSDYTSMKNLKEFVQIVRDWDTWRWVQEKEGFLSKNMNTLLQFYGREDFIIKALNVINNYLIFKNSFFTDEDMIFLDCKNKEIDNYYKEKEKTMIINNLLGYKCGIIFADKYTSELGNKICENNKEIDFVVIIDLSSKKVGYRTIKDIDLGKEIAIKFGGGGHPKSAGSEIDENKILNIIKYIFK